MDAKEKKRKKKLEIVLLCKALLAEVMGTCFLFLAGMTASLSFIRDQDILRGGQEWVNPVVGALSTGFAVVGLVYAFSDVSGAHFNPAVTFSFVVTRKFDPIKGVLYVIAQLIGSICAVLLSWFMLPYHIRPSVFASLITIRVGSDANIGQAFMTEFMLTFILMYIIFAIAFDNADFSTKKVELKNKHIEPSLTSDAAAAGITVYATSGFTKAGFAPLSIGFMVTSLCLCGGTVSGGAFSPARAFGTALVSGQWEYHWLYWLADCMGGALAAYTQKWISNPYSLMPTR